MTEKQDISLNKFISSKGLCSRREADRWIEAKRVKINGKVAKKGNRVGPDDEVSIDDQTITLKKVKPIYIKFNKPVGVTCTTDQRDETNIIDFIGYPERIFPVGRLDKDSSGLILLTNDGDIVNQILRRENNHQKEYIVTVDKPITHHFIRQMSQSMNILDQMTIPAEVEQIKKRVFRIILTQGLNRQIRRMVKLCGYHVIDLKRIRIMGIPLGNLKEGHHRNLTDSELRNIGVK